MAEPTKPLCAICGEDHDYEDHKPGSELRHEFAAEPAPSKEASDLAIEACEGGSDRVAVVLQGLMNERDRAMERWGTQFGRAEAADNAYAELRATSIEKLRLLESQRAEKAEADAALAWRRVTELQERGTELVLERRAHEERLAECLRRVRQRLCDNGPSYVYEVLEEYERPYRPAHEEMLEHPAVRLDALLLDIDAWRQKWSSHEGGNELASIVAKYEGSEP